MSGTIFSVSNIKGGVGKTTTTINLAQALAVHGLKVLVVDLDPQGNATLGLGFSGDSLEFTVADLLKDQELDSRVAIKQVSGIDFIPATRDLAEVELVMVSKAARQLWLSIRLRALLPQYNVILIDTPPNIGPLLRSSLNTVDHVIVPVDCSIYAMQGIKDILAEIKDARSATNPRVDILGYLLTMFDNTKISKDTKESMLSSFGEQVFKSIIARSVKLKESSARGESIFHHAYNSVGAMDYLRLSIEIIQRMQLLPSIDPALMELAYPPKSPQGTAEVVQSAGGAR